MKYLVLIPVLLLCGCVVAPYDPYYGAPYTYGSYYGPAYPSSTSVSFSYHDRGHYRDYHRGHYRRYWR